MFADIVWTYLNINGHLHHNFKGLNSNGGQASRKRGRGRMEKRKFEAKNSNIASMHTHTQHTNPSTPPPPPPTHPHSPCLMIDSRKKPSLKASRLKPFSSLPSAPFRGDVAYFAQLENTLARQMSDKWWFQDYSFISNGSIRKYVILYPKDPFPP